MIDQYVSVNQSQALKILGFDKKCLAVWHNDGEDWNFIPDYGATFKHPKDIPHWNTTKAWGAHIYAAPRLDQAQKWLREVKKLCVEARVENFPNEYCNDMDACYFPTIISLSGCEVALGKYWNDNLYTGVKQYYDTYELALAAGISKALELLGKEENHE